MLFPLYDENPTIRWPVVTVILITVNVAIMIYSTCLDERYRNEFHACYGFIPSRIQQLTNPNLIVEVDISPQPGGVRLDGRLPQNIRPHYLIKLGAYPHQIVLSLFTTMFLHANWVHLVGNMWMFWVYGNNIEDRLGHFIFLGFYLVGGVVAALCHGWMVPALKTNMPVIGASGAVACVLGGYAVTYPRHHIRCLLVFCFPFIIRLPALVVLGLWLAGQIVSAVDSAGLGLGGNVAWWAHIGGFSVGAIVMIVMSKIRPVPLSSTPCEILCGSSLASTAHKHTVIRQNAPPVPRRDLDIRWIDE